MIFANRNKISTTKNLKLSIIFSQVYRCHSELMSNYNVGLSESENYEDLVHKFRGTIMKTYPASKKYSTHMGPKWVFIWVLYGQPIRDS